MNTILFICSVVGICLGLSFLGLPNYTLEEEWKSDFLCILLIVGGCAGAGVVLFHLVN